MLQIEKKKKKTLTNLFEGRRKSDLSALLRRLHNGSRNISPPLADASAGHNILSKRPSLLARFDSLNDISKQFRKHIRPSTLEQLITTVFLFLLISSSPQLARLLLQKVFEKRRRTLRAAREGGASGKSLFGEGFSQRHFVEQVESEQESSE